MVGLDPPGGISWQGPFLESGLLRIRFGDPNSAGRAEEDEPRISERSSLAGGEDAQGAVNMGEHHLHVIVCGLRVAN